MEPAKLFAGNVNFSIWAYQALKSPRLVDSKQTIPFWGSAPFSESSVCRSPQRLIVSQRLLWVSPCLTDLFVTCETALIGLILFNWVEYAAADAAMIALVLELANRVSRSFGEHSSKRGDSSEWPPVDVMSGASSRDVCSTIYCCGDVRFYIAVGRVVRNYVGMVL